MYGDEIFKQLVQNLSSFSPTCLAADQGWFKVIQSEQNRPDALCRTGASVDEYLKIALKQNKIV